MLAVALLPAPSVAALDMSANAGMLLTGTVPPAGTGGPNPSIAYVLGASVRFSVGGELYLEPTLDIFTTWYEWVASAGVAVPALEETGGGFFTLGALAGAQVGIEHALSSAVSIGGSLGLDVLLRFPIPLASDVGAAAAGEAAAPAYFFGMGRFLYPETRLFFRWRVSSGLSMTMGVRALYPVFHLWDGLHQPFLDQFILSAGLGFGFSL
jgi:hypothetical protein